MEFARQEYFWLLLAIPAAVFLWGIGVWHRRRMRIRFGNIENLEAISRISRSGLAWVRGVLNLFTSSLILMTLGLACSGCGQVLRGTAPHSDAYGSGFFVDIPPPRPCTPRDMSPSRLGVTRRAEEIIQKFRGDETAARPLWADNFQLGQRGSLSPPVVKAIRRASWSTSII